MLGTRSNCSLCSLSLSLTLAEWIWLLYSQLSIVSAYCARCFTLFCLTRRANCSILRVGLHWPQRGKQAAIRVACGMWHAEHVEHWTEATLMISVRQCKTDKTHFQIVHLCYVTSARKYPRQIQGESERWRGQSLPAGETITEAWSKKRESYFSLKNTFSICFSLLLIFINSECACNYTDLKSRRKLAALAYHSINR